ncbi:MAG: VOC family protein [Fimbriimonadaceae bacterium]|nr:VOC family protein [Fimbriimonadaceae bacterium]
MIPLATLRAHHVGLVVADLEASQAWYRTHFGMEERSRTVSPTGLKIVYIGRDGFEIELFQHPEGVPLAGARKELGSSLQEGGFAHLAFACDDVDALWPALEAAGHNLASPPAVNEDLRVKYCFIRDLDGNLIEFVQVLG